MIDKIAFIGFFGIIYVYISRFIISQLSQFSQNSIFFLAFGIDIVLYFITGIVSAIVLKPKSAKNNGQILLATLITFMIINLSVENTWNWLLSLSYIIIIVISIIIAYISGILSWKCIYRKKINPAKKVKVTTKRVTKPKEKTAKKRTKKKSTGKKK